MIFHMNRPHTGSYETLARHDLGKMEFPYTLREHLALGCKTGWGTELRSVYRYANLRLGRMGRFAVVGALGTVVNLLVMALLVHEVFNTNYLVAAVVAAEISILHNFLLQERFVFGDMRDGINSRQGRLTRHLVFNNSEALVRLPFLVLLVEAMHMWALLAQAVTLAIAFIARFLFASRVVYRPEPVKRAARHRAPSDRVREVSA